MNSSGLNNNLSNHSNKSESNKQEFKSNYNGAKKDNFALKISPKRANNSNLAEDRFIACNNEVLETKNDIKNQIGKYYTKVLNNNYNIGSSPSSQIINGEKSSRGVNGSNNLNNINNNLNSKQGKKQSYYQLKNKK